MIFMNIIKKRRSGEFVNYIVISPPPFFRRSKFSFIVSGMCSLRVDIFVPCESK